MTPVPEVDGERFGIWLAAPVFAIGLALGVAAGPARADIVRADRCYDTAGEPCWPAGPDQNQSGVCTPATCSRTLPPVNGAAPMIVSYPCLTCQVVQTDGGVDAQGMTEAAKGGPRGLNAGDKKDDGCSYAGQAAPGGLFAGLAVVMTGALVRRHGRRRRP